MATPHLEDIQYKTLQRYFTLGFAYSLQKAGNGGPSGRHQNDVTPVIACTIKVSPVRDGLVH